MKKISKIFTFSILTMALFLAASCSDDDNGPTTPPEQPMDPLNIVETALGENSLSTLVAALQKADESAANDLVAALSDENGTFTVLAPNNDAFTDLLARLDGFDSLDDFNSEQLQDLLATILTYHVVSGAAVASTDLTADQSVTTLEGGTLTVSLDGGVFFTDAAGEAAQVTTPDVMTSNGIVHIIDKVLLPQAALDALADVLLVSITDLAIATPSLSNLVAALQAANGDLPTVLAGDGPFTVLAPTNEAFTAFLEANDFADLSAVPVDVLTQVLLNHVVSGTKLSTDLATGYESTLSTAGAGENNLSLFVNVADVVTLNGVSEVSAPDNKAINGVVHIVDAVIGLPNIVDHAVANPNLTSLVGLLTADDDTTFTDLLSATDTNYTVFAPVNTAFDGFTSENEIANILSNHVVVGTAALSGDLQTGYDITTAATNADGDNLNVYINTDDGVRINGVSSVAAADIVATNGIIHAVDGVIDIPTVVTFATANPDFSTLVAALTDLTPDTDFVEILSRTSGGNGDGINPDFTVFAPTNEALEAQDAIPDFFELEAVLLHHVVAGANIRSTDLTPDGTTPATTLEGDGITVTLPGSGDNIADITDGAGNTDIGIIAVDVQAGNGVIHVVNKVLIPDTTN
ncbi:fasciclin domain-containing protein [Ulvibacterium marinum]|uniref:Fasciclin domain-containing protein n=1 Tax=Ulvibacterium marinum TaxID=2419782 RepID=A0A3B0BYC1_9FLAO|nr:fasciclin domain-containing protein [Ulvibacterium marinum]RKN78072.1 fasciclin domain-containing protein [Ulvibacterium marinum]